MNLPALHQSIVDNHYEQFVGLIEQGAGVNQLDLAKEHHYADIVKLLENK
ncbi:hypothetical protein [Vibrio owensii]